jgi:hypothetical protein
VRSALEWAQVRTLAAEGLSQREIARRLAASLIQDESPGAAIATTTPAQQRSARALADLRLQSSPHLPPCEPPVPVFRRTSAKNRGLCQAL